MLKKYQQTANRVVQFVNNITGVNRKTLDAFAPRKMRNTLLEMAKHCVNTGLVVGHLGQISIRLSADKLLMTASGTSFSRMRDQDLILVSYTGDWSTADDRLGNKTDWHKAVYQNNKAKAVLFCQPTAALTISSYPDVLNSKGLQDAYCTAEQIGFIKQGEDDIQDLANSHQVILIEGKGMLSWGDSLEDAIDLAEVTERFCQVALNVSALRK